MAQALRAARLAPLRRGRARAALKCERLPAASTCCRRASAGEGRCSTAARPCPACASDGERLVGSRAIMRRLDAARARAAAAAAPATPRACASLEAERWGDEVLQAVPRRSSTPPSCATRARWRATPATPSCRCPRALHAPVAAADGRARGMRNKARRRRRAPTSRRCPRSSTASTAGSPRACSAASSPTPPTCRSAPRSGCC